MTTRAAKASLVGIARITGVFFLVMSFGAGFAEFGVHRALVVPGDAAATAGKILASEQLFRLGFVGYLIAFLRDVLVSILLYVLLRSVSKPLALSAAAFRHTAFASAILLNYLGAAFFLSGAGYLSVFETSQLHALALFSLDMFKQGFSLALMFFGFHLLLLEVLLFKSSYFPKLRALASAMRSITAPGKRYDVRSYKYVVPRTAGSLERFADALDEYT